MPLESASNQHSIISRKSIIIYIDERTLFYLENTKTQSGLCPVSRAYFQRACSVFQSQVNFGIVTLKYTVLVVRQSQQNTPKFHACL